LERGWWEWSVGGEGRIAGRAKGEWGEGKRERCGGEGERERPAGSSIETTLPAAKAPSTAITSVRRSGGSRPASIVTWKLCDTAERERERERKK